MGGHGLVHHSHLSIDSFPNVRDASSLCSSPVRPKSIGSIGPIHSQVQRPGAEKGSLLAVAVG